jgi:PTH1 family peptidyl-tRNA hydrolase
MKLIVGLGNPGVEYAWTRHNSGWIMLDSFVSRLGLTEPQMKFRGAFWGPVLHDGIRFSLLKPYTFMNLSGLAVAEAVKYQNIGTSDVLVIYDDAALPFGKLRMRESGSAGGQKGMMSIIGALDTLEIPRLRIGIGRAERTDMAEWVLGHIPLSQRKNWNKLEDVAWKAVNMWLTGDTQNAMNSINGFNLQDETTDT